MRKAFALLAAGAALVTVPALAQVVGGTVDTGVGVDTAPLGATVGTVTDRVGQTVDQVDGAASRTIDSTKLTLANSEQVRAGVNITDRAGNSVGTVQSVDGENAIVVDGGKLYNIPLGSLYSSAEGATNTLVTKLPKAQIAARVQGGAQTR
jgi:hypothetical protein